MSANPPAANSTPAPESRSARLRRLAEENLADELIVEPARKRIKARETEMLALLQTKDPETPKFVEDDKNHHADAPVAVVQGEGPQSAFFKMLQAFKKTPPFVDELTCFYCLQDDPNQPILASCLHTFCNSCFKSLIEGSGIESNHNQDLTTVSCYESHPGPNNEMFYETQIDSYAELNGEELLQLKSMLNGEDVDIRKMAALHKPKPDRELQRLWKKLVGGRK